MLSFTQLIQPIHDPHHRYTNDQVFTDTLINSIFSMTVIDGSWYVVVKGDYAGLVSGAVYDLTNTTAPSKVATTVSTCCDVEGLGFRECGVEVGVRVLHDLRFQTAINCVRSHAHACYSCLLGSRWLQQLQTETEFRICNG